MGSAFAKDVKRSITGSIGRFLAILAITALGCGFYAGLRMSGEDMRFAADAFFDDTRLYDLRLLSSLGFGDGQVADLASVEGVETVMPARSVDVMVTLHGEQYAVRVASLDVDAASRSVTHDRRTVTSDDDGYLNRLLLVSGTWPRTPGECVLSADRIMGEPIQPGDEVEVLYGSQDLEDVLEARTYTVTGLVSSSSFVSSTMLGTTTLGSGTLNQYMYVAPGSFAGDCPYTELFVRVAGAADERSYSDAYQARVDEVAARIEAKMPDIAAARLDEIRQDAQSELDEGRRTYERERDDAYAQLDAAAAQLDAALAELESGRADLAAGQREYEAGLAQYRSSKAQADEALAAARAELDKQQGVLDAAQKEYEAGLAEWEEGASQWKAAKADLEKQVAALEAQIASGTLPEEEVAKLKAQAAAVEQQVGEKDAELAAAKAKLDAAKAKLDEGRAQLVQGEEAYRSQKASSEEQLAAAKARLDAAEAELEEGRARLASGEREYRSGRASYEANRATAVEKLADAAQVLANAQKDIDELSVPDLYLLDRTKNLGAASFEADSERIDHIAEVFPFIFFLVAALVSLTTMTRMVEEERTLIGTYKALGYSTPKVASKYLLYAALASVTGAVIGIAVFSQVLPKVVCKAYGIIYCVPQPEVPLAIDLSKALLSAGMGVGITLAATAAAVAATLREQPAALMLPRAPAPGKRILLEHVGPLWRRLSFSWKVTCRNLFRYRKRLWMTVIGIAGCTALLLTGLGLHDSIWDIIDKQFGDITHFNTTVKLKDDAGGEQVARAEEVVRGLGQAESVTYVETANMQAGSDQADPIGVSLIVAEDADALSGFITFRERVGGDPIVLDDRSVVLTEKLAKKLGVEPGDGISLFEQDEIGNAKGEGLKLTVTGVTEQYIGYHVYVGKDVYTEVFGDAPTFRTIYASATDDAQVRTRLAEQLHENDAVETVSFNDETIDTYRKALSSVNMVVVVLVVAAAALAFIVLYNLTNINITERRREIASLKVLGFTPREVDAYIFREIGLLTLLGASLGLVLGVFMEAFVVVTAEVDLVMFGREIHPPSFIGAFLLTFVFTALVMLVMRGKLARIDMAESLKSVE